MLVIFRWRVHPCDSPTCDPPLLPPIPAREELCVNRVFEAGNLVYLQRFGNPEQNSQAITFYSGEFLSGTSRGFTEFEDNIDFEYASYFHTGAYSWGINSEDCIEADTDVNTRGCGITYAPRDAGTLTTIQQGCEFVEPSPTTTIPTTTTTIAPVECDPQFVEIFQDADCEGQSFRYTGSGLINIPGGEMFNSFRILGL